MRKFSSYLIKLSKNQWIKYLQAKIESRLENEANFSVQTRLMFIFNWNILRFILLMTAVIMKIYCMRKSIFECCIIVRRFYEFALGCTLLICNQRGCL